MTERVDACERACRKRDVSPEEERRDWKETDKWSRDGERIQKCKKKEEERGKETRCGENKRKRNSEREELLRNGIVAFDVCKGYLWIRERARARAEVRLRSYVLY